MNLRFASTLAAALAASAAFADTPANRRDAAARWSAEGLRPVDVKGLQVAYARPGAALGRYREIAIAPISVALHHDIETDSMRNPLRMTDADEQRIEAHLARLVRDELVHALNDSGLAVVEHAGPGALEIDAAITDVRLTAPDVRTPGRVDVYARSAGEMTLVAGLRDSASGEPLLRVFDRAQTFETTWPHHVTVVESDGQLRTEARNWGRAIARELGAAKSR